MIFFSIQFSIKHVTEEQILFADILTGLAKGHQTHKVSSGKKRMLYHDLVSPSNEIVMQTWTDIRNESKLETPPAESKKNTTNTSFK